MSNFLNDEYIDEVYEDVVEETDPQTEIVLSEAVKRIEQAKLYEIMLKHKLFAEGSARPEIVSVVEKEIKGFILNRLEVLLGLKAESVGSSPPSQHSLPFSQDQIEALQVLADKLLTKKTSQATSTEPVLNQVAQGQQVNTPAYGLNQVKTESWTQPASSSVNVQQKQPVKKAVRKKRSNNVSQVAIQNQDGTVTSVNTDYSQAVNPNKAPARMPTPQEMEMLAAQQAAKTQAGMGGNDIGKLLGAAIALSQQKNANLKEE